MRLVFDAGRGVTMARLECVTVLDQGRIGDEGSHSELLRRNGLYAMYWTRRLRAFIGNETPEAAE